MQEEISKSAINILRSYFKDKDFKYSSDKKNIYIKNNKDNIFVYPRTTGKIDDDGWIFGIRKTVVKKIEETL